MIWSSPLQIALSVYFLYQQLGHAIWAGLAVIILAVPLNFVITIKMRGYQLEQMKNKDKRIKLMNELLGGIKVIKLYGWETSFIDQVQGIRQNEEKVLRKSAWMSAMMSFIWTTIPNAVAYHTKKNTKFASMQKQERTSIHLIIFLWTNNFGQEN